MAVKGQWDTELDPIAWFDESLVSASSWFDERLPNVKTLLDDGYPGSFDITGSDAFGFIDSVSIADSGTFAITGSNTTVAIASPLSLLFPIVTGGVFRETSHSRRIRPLARRLSFPATKVPPANVTSIAYPEPVVSETFDGTGTLSGWTQGFFNGYNITRMTGYAGVATTYPAPEVAWKQGNWPADQSSSAVFKGSITGEQLEVLVRCQFPQIYYYLAVNGTDWNIGYIDPNTGTPTPLASGTTTLTDGDVLKLSIVGYTLTATKNGNLIGTITDTNSTIAIGAPGISIWNCSTAFLDNWEGSYSPTHFITGWYAESGRQSNSVTVPYTITGFDATGHLTSIAASASIGLTASDSFDRANGGLGSNWTAYYGSGGTILSNEARTSVGSQSQGSYWNASAFGPDQYSKIILGGTITSADFWSAGCRLSGGVTTDGYRVSGNNVNWYITRVDNGFGTDIASGSNTFAVTDTIECRVSGTTISLYKNNSLIGSQTDSAYTTGAPGFELYNNATVVAWDGGDLNSVGYALTGLESISTVTAGASIAAPSSYAITGFDTTATRQLASNAALGSHIVTGFDATSTALTGNANAEPSSYVLTGFNTVSSRDVYSNALPIWGPTPDAVEIGTRGGGTGATATSTTGTSTYGNTFAVFIGWGYGQTIDSVTDTWGNTYVPVDSFTENPVGGRFQWYLSTTNKGGAAHSATVTCSGTASPSIHLIEISNIIPVGIDQSSYSIDTGYPFTTTTGSLSQENQIALSGAGYTDNTSSCDNFTVLSIGTNIASYWESGVAKKLTNAFDPVAPIWSAIGGATITAVTFKAFAGVQLLGFVAGALVSRQSNAESGSYTLTGSDTSVLRTYVSNAVSSSYTTTGSNAIDLLFLNSNAVSSSYAVTGFDTTVTKTIVSLASSDAYVYSGVTANDLITVISNANSDAYYTTGYNTSVLVAYVSNAVPDTYVTTGLNTSIIRTHISTTTVGSYAITGFDAFATQAGGTAANPGSYVYTGLAASDFVDYKSVADPTTYALSGSATYNTRSSYSVPSSYTLTFFNTGFSQASNGASGSYTLAGSDTKSHITSFAVSSTYSLSGISTGYTIGRLSSADTTSYTITGFATGYTIARTSTTTVGPYVVTGFSTGIFSTYVSNANTSSYAVTGSPADGTKAGQTTSSADPATYSVGGASTAEHTAVNANSSAYSATGSDAFGYKAYTSLAASGTYTYSGQNTTYLYSTVSNANFGAYALTGLTAGDSLSSNAVASSYVLTGFDANSATNRIENAGSSSYSITGSDAFGVVTSVSTTLPGSYIVTGSSASGLRSYLDATDAIIYQVTGSNTTSAANRISTANTSSYLVSGTDAFATVSSTGDTSSGSYTVSGFDATALIQSISVAGIGAYDYIGFNSNSFSGTGEISVADYGTYSLNGSIAKGLVLNPDYITAIVEALLATELITGVTVQEALISMYNASLPGHCSAELAPDFAALTATILTRHAANALIPANIKQVNDLVVKGDGTDSNPWNPV